ncbi:MAG: hypothetical protein ABL962_17230 [Fimbriimonadaceae bacterium]
MKKVLTAIGLAFAISSQSLAAPIAQVDQITLSGATYPGDQWTLSLTNPGPYSFTYTVPAGADFGCNICNVVAGWGATINADPILNSLFTATYQIWDGVSFYNPVITLSGDTPGQSWTAFVSVVDGYAGGNPLPLGVSISTVVQAYNDPPPTNSVPIAPPILLLMTGLGLIAMYRRRSLTIPNLA